MQLMEIASARAAAAGAKQKSEVLYEYVVGSTEFRHRVEAIAEAFIGMQTGLQEEKRAAQRQWAADFLGRRPTVDLVVMAHTHRPIVSTIPDGRVYLNPGAFLEGGRYAVVMKDRVELKEFTTGRLPPS